MVLSLASPCTRLKLRSFCFRVDGCVEQVSKGLDKRTTIMIRNIPNKYTQAMLLQEIDASYRGAYDFFYLPIDFKNKCNVGYAFINFMDYRRIVPFFREFNGQRWKNFNSEKVGVYPRTPPPPRVFHDELEFVLK